MADPIIPVAEAKTHLRVGSDYPDDQVLPYLLAAQQSASEFLNRPIYETQQDLNDALSGVLAAMQAASEQYLAASDAAQDIEDSDIRVQEIQYADDQFALAKLKAIEPRNGIVINDAIKVAILLMAGHLFENREDVVLGMSVNMVQIPIGSIELLRPFRIGLGV